MAAAYTYHKYDHAMICSQFTPTHKVTCHSVHVVLHCTRATILGYESEKNNKPAVAHEELDESENACVLVGSEALSAGRRRRSPACYACRASWPIKGLVIYLSRARLSLSFYLFTIKKVI